MTTPRSPRQGGQLSPSASRLGLLVAVCLCYLAVGLSVVPVPRLVTDDFRGDDRQVGLIMGAYAFTAIASRVATGFLMRKLGYRWSLALSSGVLVVSTLLCALAPNASALLAARLLLGVGVGAMMAVSTAWMVDLPSARSSVGRSIGSIGTVNYTVLAIAAPVSAFLDASGGHRAALVVAAAFPLLAIFFIPFLLAASAAPQDEAHTSEAPVKRVLSASLVPGAALMTSGFGYAAIVSFGVQLTAARQVGNAGLLIFAYGATMVASRLLLGSRMDELARPLPIAAIFLVEGIGLACLALAHSLIGIMGAAVIIGASMACIYPMLGVQVADRAGPDRGTALSVFGAFINLGIGLGSAALGLVAHATDIPSAVIVAALIVAFGGGLAASLQIRSEKSEERQTDSPG